MNQVAATNSSALQQRQKNSNISQIERNDSDRQNSVNKWNRNGFGKAIEPTIGKFSQAESQTVKGAVEEYCTIHGVTPARLCSESDNRTDHLRGAWMEIAKKLPHRTVQSVYRHGLRLMHPFKRGNWSDDETNELLLLVTKHGKKWSEIQVKLNRSADSCRDKYREFHTNYTKGKWQDAESEQLELHVREFLKVGLDVHLTELGRLAEQDSVSIPWSVISKKMKNRSRLSCFKRFQQITGMKKTGKKRKRDTSRVNYTGNGNTLPASNVSTAANMFQGSGQMSSAQSSISISTPNPIQAANSEPLAVPDPTADSNDMSTYDRQLLNALATSSYARDGDVAWNAVRYPLGDAKERWHELLDKWIEAYGEDEDEVMDRPIWEVAKEILNQGLEGAEDQAEIAARTVEAVFLC